MIKTKEQVTNFTHTQMYQFLKKLKTNFNTMWS